MDGPSLDLKSPLIVDQHNLLHRQITSSGLESSASHTPKTDLDYGTLLCTASNDIGRMVQPCVFHIVPAGEQSFGVREHREFGHLKYGSGSKEFIGWIYWL